MTSTELWLISATATAAATAAAATAATAATAEEGGPATWRHHKERQTATVGHGV